MPSEMLHVHVALAQHLHRVQDVDQGSAEPIDPPHDDGVARFDVGEKLFHPGALDRVLASGGDVGEHVAFLHSGLDEGIELQLCVLARSADPRIPEMSHPTLVPQKTPASTRRRQNTARHVSETPGAPESRQFVSSCETRNRRLEKLYFYKTHCACHKTSPSR